MTTGCKTATLFLTVLCALLLAILGVYQQWDPWVWPTLGAILLVAPLAIFRTARAGGGALPLELEEHITAPPVERSEYRLSQVVIPSHWADYDFLLTATVRWCVVGPPGTDYVLNPAGLAVDAVLERARAVTERRVPGRCSLAQHELAGQLSKMLPDRSGHLRAMAENVTLRLREEDQQRLDSLAGVRKDRAVWEHQRKYEQSKRQYLSEDVLKDTGSAVVWWLAKNDEHIERTVSDIGLLATLTSAANDTDIPERLRGLFEEPGAPPPAGAAPEPPAPPEPEPTAADRFAEFIGSAGLREEDERVTLLAHQLADLARSQGRHDTAEELRLRFDTYRADTAAHGPDPGVPGSANGTAASHPGTGEGVSGADGAHPNGSGPRGGADSR